MKISIPDNVGGVSALLTTRKWEKAAIVWAYVHSSENQAHVKSDMKPYFNLLTDTLVHINNVTPQQEAASA